MGKLVVTEFVTVDGVFEDPGGSEDFERGGWSFEFNRGEDGDKFKLDETLNSDALLLGRSDLRRLCRCLAEAVGRRVLRQVQQHAEACRVLHREGSRVEQLDGDQRGPGEGGLEAQGASTTRT